MPLDNSAKASLNEQIKALLIQRFEKMPLETRLPSDRQLAAELEVAYLTINRAMRELEREGYVERRPRKGTFLASRERTVEREIFNMPAEKIIFAYPNYFSFDFWQRLHFAEEYTLKEGMGLTEFKMNSETTYSRLLEFIRHQEKIRGIMIIPLPDSITPALVKALDELNLPVTLLGPAEAVEHSKRVYSVCSDWTQSGFLHGEELFKTGHQRIAHIHNEPAGEERKLLTKGLRQAARQYKRKIRDIVVYDSGVANWDDSREAGYKLALEALKDPTITGLIFESIAGVRGALRLFGEKNIPIPEAFSIITNGMMNGSEQYHCPAITTVDGDNAGAVRLALDIILGKTHPEQKILTTDVNVIPRESIAPPKSS